MKLSFEKVMNPLAKYTENDQWITCKYSICEVKDDTVYPLFKPVLCREYLTDILGKMFKVLGPEDYVYGFNAPTSVPTDKTRFYFIPWQDNRLEKPVEEALIPIEKSLGISETKLTVLDNGHYLIEGDPIWMSHTLLMSWYSAAFRVLSHPVEKWEKLHLYVQASSGCVDWKRFSLMPKACLETNWKGKCVTPHPNIDYFHATNGHIMAYGGSEVNHMDMQGVKQFREILGRLYA